MMPRKSHLAIMKKNDDFSGLVTERKTTAHARISFWNSPFTHAHKVGNNKDRSSGLVICKLKMNAELSILVLALLLAFSSVSFCRYDRQIRLPSGDPYMYPSLDSSSICPNKTTPLYFGLIQSFSTSQIDGSGTILGVNIALDRINSNCFVLPGYSLHYTVADSQVSIIYLSA